MSDHLVAALIEQILEQSFVLDTDIGGLLIVYVRFLIN